jgi:hypothetical protein
MRSTDGADARTADSETRRRDRYVGGSGWRNGGALPAAGVYDLAAWRRSGERANGSLGIVPSLSFCTLSVEWLSECRRAELLDQFKLPSYHH